jgi:hypothetical protein
MALRGIRVHLTSHSSWADERSGAASGISGLESHEAQPNPDMRMSRDDRYHNAFPVRTSPLSDLFFVKSTHL